MAILRILAGFTILLFTSCGLSLPAREGGVNAPKTLGITPLEGTFQEINGNTVDLSLDNNLGQILFFASETCSICRRESQALVANLANRGSPTNIRFYTVLVGSLPQDAQDWKNELGVSWIVGTDSGDLLFRKYCAEAQTPCVLLRNPQTKIVTKLIGDNPLETWAEHTGAWIY